MRYTNIHISKHAKRRYLQKHTGIPLECQEQSDLDWANGIIIKLMSENTEVKFTDARKLTSIKLTKNVLYFVNPNKTLLFVCKPKNRLLTVVTIVRI